VKAVVGQRYLFDEGPEWVMFFKVTSIEATDENTTVAFYDEYTVDGREEESSLKISKGSYIESGFDLPPVKERIRQRAIKIIWRDF
jgi:hypothetical protein